MHNATNAFSIPTTKMRSATHRGSLKCVVFPPDSMKMRTPKYPWRGACYVWWMGLDECPCQRQCRCNMPWFPQSPRNGTCIITERLSRHRSLPFLCVRREMNRQISDGSLHLLMLFIQPFIVSPNGNQINKT